MARTITSPIPDSQRCPRSRSGCGTILAGLYWILGLAWYSFAELWLRRQIVGRRFPTIRWFHTTFGSIPGYRSGFSRLAARNHETAWIAEVEISHEYSRVSVDLRVQVDVSILALYVSARSAPILAVNRIGACGRLQTLVECRLENSLPEITHLVEQLADTTTFAFALSALEALDHTGRQTTQPCPP